MLASSSMIFSDDSGSLARFIENIELAIRQGARSLYLLACAQNQFAPNELDPYLSQLSVPVFGGIFPQVLYQDQLLERGSLVCGLNICPNVELIHSLSNHHADYSAQASRFRLRLPRHSTLVVLIDSINGRVNRLLEDLYYSFGEEHRYIGTRVGVPNLKQQASIFTNQGMQQDCAQIIALDYQCHLRIAHGWQRLAGPFLVTGSYKNTITSLDYSPAVEYYMRILTANQAVDKGEHFNQIAARHPLGIDALDRHDIVRTILNNQDGSLTCTGEVLSNQLIYILRGDPDQLITAAQQAVQQAVAAAQQSIMPMVMLFDCAGRKAFLQQRFTEEIQAMQAEIPDHCLLVGALSFGEIAGDDNLCMELFNKATLVATFTEHPIP